MATRLFVFVLSLLAVGALAAETFSSPKEAAAKSEGADVRFVGLVQEVKVTDKGTIFLNFGGKYPNETITAILLASRSSAFDEVLDQGPKWLTGRRVQVSGRITIHEGHPRVILRSRDQLKVLAQEIPPQ